MSFEPFSKISRLYRDIVVTEKLDGTNAQIYIEVDCDVDSPDEKYRIAAIDGLSIFAGSRNRYIVPGDDNFAFAKFVYDNREELINLGPGKHFGEWWGQGIGRKYDMKEKRFSLFNTARWGEERPACCDVVPVLYAGPFDTAEIDAVMGRLRTEGSVAAPGFMNPEGIVVFHTHSGMLFKATLDKNDAHKYEHV